MGRAATQRTDEWERLDRRELHYHLKQWRETKRSTIAFEAFCSGHLGASGTVMDLGCGAGACTAYLAAKYPKTQFIGLDFSKKLVKLGNKISSRKRIQNLSFEQGDWFDLYEKKGVDGVVSLQTLSWLPECKTPLTELIRKIQPKWISLTTLFYPGDITAWIEIEEHTTGIRKFYNTYSIPALARLAETEGYTVSKVESFEIDIDIEKPPVVDYMGTYTQRTFREGTEGFKRLQMTGPLLTSWYMILLERVDLGSAASR